MVRIVDHSPDGSQLRHATPGHHQDAVSWIETGLGCLPDQDSMQSIEARKEYKNSFACAAKIFREEGLLTFWSGALPRLVRLSVWFPSECETDTDRGPS